MLEGLCILLERKRAMTEQEAKELIGERVYYLDYSAVTELVEESIVVEKIEGGNAVGYWGETIPLSACCASKDHCVDILDFVESFTDNLPTQEQLQSMKAIMNKSQGDLK